MDYTYDGFPPVPGQAQQQSAPAAQTSADSTLISANDTYTQQSYAYANTTAQQPRVEQSYYQADPYTNYQPQHSTQNTGANARKSSGSGASSLLLGVMGGLVGAIALILVLALTGVIGFKSTGTQQKAQSASSPIQISADAEDITVATAVAAKTTPSVVAVYCDYTSGSGMGSGVILDGEGNILTNYHVVEDATAISVNIDGSSYECTVVGTDSSSDLAVIHAELNGTLVTPMEIGDSDALQVGDWVMTVGSPFGLESSVSQGIVSSLYRNEIMTTSSGNTLYANLIQVDAAINPGNSGGALVNSEGQLVGICTLYSSDTESFAGIGFAIPGNYAVEIANKIISGEKVTHAYIGLSMQTVTEANAQANNLSVDYGAYVAEVMAGSPAEEAGIQEGDVIIAIDGEKIDSSDAAVLAVRSHSIGETVDVEVMRGGEKKTVSVTFADDTALQERQETESQQQNTDSRKSPYGQNQDFDYDYDYDYNYNDTDSYNFDDFLEELYDMMGQNGNGNGRNNGYNGNGGNGNGFPFGN